MMLYICNSIENVPALELISVASLNVYLNSMWSYLCNKNFGLVEYFVKYFLKNSKNDSYSVTNFVRILT